MNKSLSYSVLLILLILSYINQLFVLKKMTEGKGRVEQPTVLFHLSPSLLISELKVERWSNVTISRSKMKTVKLLL